MTKKIKKNLEKKNYKNVFLVKLALKKKIHFRSFIKA